MTDTAERPRKAPRPGYRDSAGFRVIDKFGDAEFPTEVCIRQDRHGTIISIEQDNGELFVMIGSKELPRLIQALQAAEHEIQTVKASAKKIDAMMGLAR